MCGTVTVLPSMTEPLRLQQSHLESIFAVRAVQHIDVSAPHLGGPVSAIPQVPIYLVTVGAIPIPRYH